jgi:MerR family transcriptional regulator, light-induced transcriptional regulator
MRRLGEQWADGTISVGDEHRATSVAMRIVGRLSPLFSRPGRHRPGTVVLAGVAGDPHVIPGAMVVDVLRGQGFSVVDLGADVPTPVLLEALEPAGDVIAVGLSLSAGRFASSAAETIADVRRGHPALALLAGGPALEDRSSALGLGADHWARDAAAVVELVKDLSLTSSLRAQPPPASP